MTITPFNILVVIALIMAILALIKPEWPLLAVAVILMAVALLVGH
jgi:hypothetical protein